MCYATYYVLNIAILAGRLEMLYHQLYKQWKQDFIWISLAPTKSVFFYFTIPEIRRRT